jgi:sortase A
MRAGLVVLLFVAYQLWGTGLQTDRTQDRLSNELEQLFEQSAAPGTTVDTLPPGTPALPPTAASTDVPVPENGDPIGRIRIPQIDVDFVFVQGVDLRDLRDGPGHFPQTPLPGQPGNAALAGHRTTYAAPFHRLDEVAPGSDITVETVQGTFTYRVDPHQTPEGESVGHFIVKPSAVEILEQDGTNRLTLMACHPKYSAAQRIVVTASLVSNPAPATAIPADVPQAAVAFDASQDPLAGGDASAWPTAIGWTIAALAAWFLMWFVGQWLYRRHDSRAWQVPPYVVGVPIVVVLLFLAFQDIARLLPAAY